jgi:hypothetical protein
MESNPKCDSICCPVDIPYDVTKNAGPTSVWKRHDSQCQTRSQLGIYSRKKTKAENAKRIAHTYAVGAQVLLRRGTENKYETPFKGPFTILKVNDNGTVRMQVKNVEDTFNI